MIRKLSLGLFIILIIANTGYGQSSTSAVSYTTVDRGGTTISTAGGIDAMVVGSARVQPSSSTTPSGVAIFGLRQNGVLVTEAGVPGMSAMVSGRTYAEVNGAINTGVAFSNPNTSAVTVTFSFTDESGNALGQGSLTLGANAQMARFLNEAPFNAGANFRGTVSFSASAGVGVIALRTFVNERGEFLVTTQTVVSLQTSQPGGTLIMGHFAVGGGWTSQVMLVNTTDAAMSGTVQFFDEGSAAISAAPLSFYVNGQFTASFNYSIRARSSERLDISGITTGVVQVGSVRITTDGTNTNPAAFTVFSYSTGGATVSMATVQAQPPGSAFRSYAEVNSRAGVAGAIQSGIAITNNSSTAATVNFELTSLDGTSAGLTSSVVVAAYGHTSKFVHELFPTLSLPFRGVVRVSSANSLSVVSLRMRYNERGDFLVTTTPASDEASASTTAELLFPHIVDRGGYSTEFVLFSGVAGQTSTGMMRFFTQDGQALSLSVR